MFVHNFLKVMSRKKRHFFQDWWRVMRLEEIAIAHFLVYTRLYMWISTFIKLSRPREHIFPCQRVSLISGKFSGTNEFSWINACWFCCLIYALPFFTQKFSYCIRNFTKPYAFLSFYPLLYIWTLWSFILLSNGILSNGSNRKSENFQFCIRMQIHFSYSEGIFMYLSIFLTNKEVSHVI